MIQSYFINMLDDVERRSFMERQGNALGISLQRIDAASISNLSDNDLARVERVGERYGSLRSLAGLACFVSHRAAWEKAAGSAMSFTAIFEDDVHFSHQVGNYLRDHSWIPADADIIRIERYRSYFVGIAAHDKLADGRRLHRYLGRDAATAGYIISRDCARRLHADFNQVDREFDQILFGGWSAIFSSLRIYALSPALCIQDQKSDLYNLEPAALGSGIRRHSSRVLSWKARIKVIEHTLSRPFAYAYADIAKGLNLNRRVRIRNDFC